MAVRTEKYRYVEYGGGKGGAMLFDEENDPHETKNLADDPKYAAVRAELSAKCKQTGEQGAVKLVPPTSRGVSMSASRYCGLVLALCAAVLGGSPAVAATRPNILILLADDLGYADVGFQGCKDIPTPNIDSLAKNGVRCTNGYVSGPYCSPTRAGLLTGRYQQRFGHEFNPGDGAGDIGPAAHARRRSPTGSRPPATPPAWSASGTSAARRSSTRQKRGFDEFFGFLGGAHSYFPRQGRRRSIAAPRSSTEKEYLTDAFAREAVALHRPAPEGAVLPLPGVQRRPHADAGDRRALSAFAAIEDKQRRTYAAMHAGDGRGGRQGARQAPRAPAWRRTR